MKTIDERILDALRRLGSMTFGELSMETVRCCEKLPDASLSGLEKALDDLRDHGLIELHISHFRLTRGEGHVAVD